LGSKRIKVLSTLSPTAPITNTRFNSLLAPVAAIMKKTIFIVSSWIMTGDYIWALIGGILGFIWSLTAFRIISVKFPKRIMKNVAVGLLYTIGFIILTSGLI